MKTFFSQLPWSELEPSQQLLARGTVDAVIGATNELRMIVAYTPRPQPLSLVIEGDYHGRWFNPADGATQPAALSRSEAQVTAQPPAWEQDAILLLQRA